MIGRVEAAEHRERIVASRPVTAGQGPDGLDRTLVADRPGRGHGARRTRRARACRARRARHRGAEEGRRREDERAGRIQRRGDEALRGDDLEPLGEIEAPADPRLGEERVEHRPVQAPPVEVRYWAYAGSTSIVALACSAPYQFVNADVVRVSIWPLIP